MKIDWRKICNHELFRIPSPILKGEYKRTFIFFLSGFLLTFCAFIFLSADVHYLRGSGAAFQVTKNSIVFGTVVTLLGGWLLPALCYWFKFYRWWLAWMMMAIVFASILFIDMTENDPKTVFNRQFGKLADGVQLEALVKDKGYESSFDTFRLSGNNAVKIQVALQSVFPDGKEQDLSSNFRRLPEFMRPRYLPDKMIGWQYSSFVWAWRSPEGELYVFFNTWDYAADQERWKKAIQDRTEWRRSREEK